MPRLTSFNGFLVLDRSLNEAWLLGLRLVHSSLSPVAPSKRRAHPMCSPHLDMHGCFPGPEHASCLICAWSDPHLHKAFCLRGHSLAPSPCPHPPALWQRRDLALAVVRIAVHLPHTQSAPHTRVPYSTHFMLLEPGMKSPIVRN